DKEVLFDKIVDLRAKNDIDFKDYPNFSKNITLTSDYEVAIRNLFNDDLIRFFENNSVYHIECNGKQLVIFKTMRLASVDEIKELVDYSYELCKLLLKT